MPPGREPRDCCAPVEMQQVRSQTGSRIVKRNICIICICMHRCMIHHFKRNDMILIFKFSPSHVKHLSSEPFEIMNILTFFFRVIFNSPDKKLSAWASRLVRALPYLKPSRQALNDRFQKAGQNIIISILSCLGEIFYLMNSPRETSNIYHSTP